MFIKSFNDFISENVVRNPKPKHIEDIKKEDDGTDKDLEKKVQDELQEVEEECIRCGEHIEDCKCPSEDPWSTQVYHRAPKGEVKQSKPKQEFKK